MLTTGLLARLLPSFLVLTLLSGCGGSSAPPAPAISVSVSPTAATLIGGGTQTFVATLGSMCGDQLAYYLGRTRGAALLAKRPHWQARVAKARRLFERHKVPVMIGFRFLYGLRNVTPLIIGVSGVSYRIFALLNA
ncbi:hypothetical protein B4Q13_24855, partial [Lacticaseibacillus rhamnosus]